jgi:hypothetical protein
MKFDAGVSNFSPIIGMNPPCFKTGLILPKNPRVLFVNLSPVDVIMMINLSRFLVQKIRVKVLFLGTLSALGILTGFVPHFTPNLAPSIGTSSALAQGITPEEISNYARSILAIEQQRSQAYQEVEAILRYVPAIDCRNTDSVNQLDRDVRVIVVNYCEGSKNLVINNGLTITRFNEITETVKTNPELETRLREALSRLQ